MIKTFFIVLILSECCSWGQVSLGSVTVTNLTLMPNFAQIVDSSVDTLAANTNATWDYTAGTISISTNQSVWTWPVNLSWLGGTTNSGGNYQAILLSSNCILTCAHFGGLYGVNVNFRDTNGVIWAAICTNDVQINGGDEEIGQLSNAIPASVVTPYVLPVNWTNYISGHTLIGLRGVWCRKNGGSDTNNPFSSTLQYSTLDNNSSMTASLIGPWGQGWGASGGDSDSPGILIYSNLPVVLFATFTYDGVYGGFSGGGGGPFVSDPAQWSSLAATGLTNGIKVLNLTGLRQFAQ